MNKYSCNIIITLRRVVYVQIVYITIDTINILFTFQLMIRIANEVLRRTATQRRNDEVHVINFSE